MKRQCFVCGAIPSPCGKYTTNLAVCAISSLQFMNRAFSLASRSPSFCRLCAKASAILFPFQSACRLRTGCQANTKFSQMMRVSALVLLLAPAAGWAGWQIWLACLACPMQAVWEGMPACSASTSFRRLAPNGHIFTHKSTWLWKCWIACEGNSAGLVLRIYISPAFV